jgi:hypothetical protein
LSKTLPILKSTVQINNEEDEMIALRRQSPGCKATGCAKAAAMRSEQPSDPSSIQEFNHNAEVFI